MTTESTTFHRIEYQATNMLARCMSADHTLIQQPELFRQVYMAVIVHSYTDSGLTLTDSPEDEAQFRRFCDLHSSSIRENASRMFAHHVVAGLETKQKAKGWLPKVGAFLGGALLSSLF